MASGMIQVNFDAVPLTETLDAIKGELLRTGTDLPQEVIDRIRNCPVDSVAKSQTRTASGTVTVVTLEPSQWLRDVLAALRAAH